jgi:phage/plasmid-associated DNA primase
MVFAAQAPRYWERGLSVIPVLGKRPVQKEWSKWALELPSVEERERWLLEFGDERYGIGLVCGPQSGICAVDIDSDEDRVIGAIERVLPRSGWERVGKKGKVLIYKFRDPRNFTIKGVDGKGLIDILSLKRQFVLPPSIHPDTGRAYWANRDLLEVLDTDGLADLPNGLDQVLKAALKDVGIETSSTSGRTIVTNYVSSGNRDNTLLKICGLYSKEIVDGNWTFLQQVERLEGWVEGFVEKVWGDTLDVGHAIERLVYCLRRDVFEHGKTLPAGWDEGLGDEDRERLGLVDFDDSRRRWSFKEILDWFNGEVAAGGGVDVNDESQMMVLVDKALVRIAGNVDLVSTEEDRLLKIICDTARGTFRIVSLRKRVKELRRGVVVGETHAEVADAILKLIEEDGEVRFCNGRFWQWVGSHWHGLQDSDLLHLIIKNSSGMQSAKKNSDYHGVLRTMQSTRTTELVRVAIKGVNFVNGFLDEDLTLRPHDRDYGATYCLNYAYEAGLAGDCLLWHNMLRDFWGEDEDYLDKVQALREAMAATIFGVATRYQRAFIFKGVAGAGKTRILHLMRSLMPPGTHSAVPPEKFAEKFESTELAGKLMNLAGELSKQKIPGKYFKTIIEGGELQGQFKNKPVFSYNPICAHWFGSNHWPKVDDPDGGWLRRWLFFRFDRPLDPAKRIDNVEELILGEEREAIMAWAVEGIRTLKINREYRLSKSHYESIEEMNRSGDSVGFWWGHFVESGRLRFGMAQHTQATQKFTSVDHLFRAYRLFCSSTAAVSHVGVQTFIERMVEIGVKKGFSPIRQEGGGITAFLFLTLCAESPVGSPSANGTGLK